MTQAKHTPGPWVVREDARDWAIIGPEPSWVTGVDRRNHNAEANARLIAAAPELLAALEKVRDDLADIPLAGRPMTMEEGLRVKALWELATTLSAKARGLQ